MKNNIGYIGIDPSIKHCGLTIIDTEEKEVHTFEYGIEEYDNKSTLQTFEALKTICRLTKRHIRGIFDDNTYVIGMEVPMAKGMFMDSEMYALASHIYHTLDTTSNYTSLYSPSYLKFIQHCIVPYRIVRHRNGTEDKEYAKYHKFYTQQLVTEVLIPVFLGFGYIVNFELENVSHPTEKDPNYKNRYMKYRLVSDGVADSFIYAVREFIKYNKDSKLALTLISHCPRLDEANKELK